MGGSHGHGGGGAYAASLTRYAWLSIVAAVLTISLKSAAFAITGSVGLLSDALESVVNLVAALIALAALRYAARPADAEHHFGHGKVEYLSAGVEGTMILVAAALIIYEAVRRLMDPQPLESVPLGLAVTAVATAINLGVGLLLIRVGREHRSIVLEADGRHLMTDVWTTVGVIIGVLLVMLTGWERLDPIIAIAVAVNIVVIGVGIVRRAGQGLLDAALPPEEHALVDAALAELASREVQFHAVTSRQSGRDRFVAMHVLVPGSWTVQQAHDLTERIEHAVEDALPGAVVSTHVEPIDDPRSYEDYAAGTAVGIDADDDPLATG